MEGITNLGLGTLREAKLLVDTGSLSTFFFANTFVFIFAIRVASALVQNFAVVFHIDELIFRADICLFLADL